MAFDEARRLLARTGFLPILGMAWLAVMTARAPGAEIRAVVELFTSQGCSSCPPADRLLGELAQDRSIVALTLPVDYWDYLGWKDTLASPHYSARQRAYAGMRGDRDVATPQVVVNGVAAVIGSDRGAIEQAILQTRETVTTAPVTIGAQGDSLRISVAAVGGDAVKGEVWLCAVAKLVPVTVGRGENSGRSLTYHNVGRRWLKLGEWSGEAASWTVPLSEIQSVSTDAAVAIIQSGNPEKPGPILGAAFTHLR